MRHNYFLLRKENIRIIILRVTQIVAVICFIVHNDRERVMSMRQCYRNVWSPFDRIIIMKASFAYLGEDYPVFRCIFSAL